MIATTLKVGVIGVGHLGQHHARLYSELPRTHLVGVADVDDHRLDEIGHRFGVPTFSRYQDLVGQVDAVSVAVPTVRHLEVVQSCLAAGVHVLVEKPLAVTPDEGRLMVRRAKEHGLVLQVGHVERFNPVSDLVRAMVGNPQFIECHRLAPFQSRGTDVDVTLDLMIHDVDLVLSFGLGAVSRVDAVGFSVLSGKVDFAHARVEFSGGCLVNFTASRISTGRLRTMRLFQDMLYLSVDFHSRRGMVYRQTGLGTPESVVEESIQGGDAEPLKRELEAFVHSVQTGAPGGVSGDEGLAALEVVHAIGHSIHGVTRPSAGRSIAGS